MVVLFKDGQPIESYRMDDTENGSAIYYLFDGGKLSKSLSFAILHGPFMKNEDIYHYDEDGSLESIHSISNGQTGVVYQS